jgi:hypothetical protein
MSSPSRPTTVAYMRRPRLRDEHGNALIIVILVSLLVGALSSLALTTGRQASWSAASDRNHEAALGVAEAGVQKVIARMGAQKSGAYSGGCAYLSMVPGEVIDSAACDGSTDQGPYELVVTRTEDGFVIDSLGRVGGTSLGRGRRVLVSVLPPRIFPDDSADYTLFSNTDITIKNGDHLNAGDIFANRSITLEPNTIVDGSVTSALGTVHTENNSSVKNIWSGGPGVAGGWAIDVGGAVTGWVKASASNPADCSSLPNANYNVRLGTAHPTVTTLGSVTGTPGAGSAGGTCTSAAAPRAITSFVYDPTNYATNPPTLHEFTNTTALADFNAWRAAHPGPVHGTFYVMPPFTPTGQSSRIDLTGWSIDGTTTIITNYPVYTGEIDDDALAPGATAKFVVVSHYAPTDSSCDANQFNSDCAIFAKNHFDASCRTATLLYADKGPVAFQNNSKLCGAVHSEAILVQNNQELNYDQKIDRVIGFGRTAWEIARWEEAKP